MPSLKSRKELAIWVYRVISNPKDSAESGDRILKMVEKAIRDQQKKYGE